MKTVSGMIVFTDVFGEEIRNFILLELENYQKVEK